ncbi:Cofilin/tropomyosin-type actin-binding protein [Oesophagostomum dentatum]|uniref:Cofilin/tropomyosin-type actin-binding protein n=2 Tax=Oesophagostomum dentatum TaxID=61180 RepID=A0A0B1SHZ9_OESDE|nr:Cofilin/tropomyosin-type actin-binding protein [Oesophagostomum dentatum]
MTLNFQKHGAAIQAAYDRVAESKTNDEWFILDYEGNSNVIKIGEEGDYGLDEFCTSFNSGRLQYGVIGVRLAKTALTKIVLVHWQGEGVPSSRVASATSHIDDVRRYLKSVHVVHYARSEIDVEPEVICKEVAKLPATHANTDADTYYSAPTPVGSVYKPTKPHVEISMKQRDEFWEKLRKEEAR